MVTLPSMAPRRSRRSLVLVALALAAITGLVWSGALRYFFAQDDFVGLARARGLLPRLAGPWRLWSNQLHFDALLALGGLDPRPFHAANLAAHALAAVALYALLARRLSRSAAFVGAALYVTHPVAFTALHWASAIGDPLALALALLALLAAEGGPRARWAAPALFAAALLAKESVALLPLAAVAVRHLGPPRGTRAARRPAVLPHELAMLAVALAYAVAFLIQDVVGVRSGAAAGSAYALGLGRETASHLVTLLGWTADPFVFAYPTRFDNVDLRVAPWALGFVALLAVGATARPLRARGWLAALALYVLFLLPVLPLRVHLYRYFLVAPLAGAAWAAAAAFDALPLARPPRRALAAALALALTVNGALVVRWAEGAPSAFPGLLADSTADRERIARQVLLALQQARLPAGAPLVFLRPRLRADAAGPYADRLEGLSAYFERNLRSAIAETLAVRLYVPEAGAVRFARARGPAPPDTRWVLYGPDGRCWVGTGAELDARLTRVPAR